MDLGIILLAAQLSPLWGGPQRQQSQLQTYPRNVGFIVALDLSGNMLAANPVNIFGSEAECVKDLETRGSPKLNTVFRFLAGVRYHKFLNSHAAVLKDVDAEGNPSWRLIYVGCAVDRPYAPTAQEQGKAMNVDFEKLLDQAAAYAQSIENADR